MDWECQEHRDGDLWVSCSVIDNTTSKTHMFVRIETSGGPEHRWIENERVRPINSHIEPSH